MQKSEKFEESVEMANLVAAYLVRRGGRIAYDLDNTEPSRSFYCWMNEVQAMPDDEGISYVWLQISTWCRKALAHESAHPMSQLSADDQRAIRVACGVMKAYLD